VFSKLLLLTVMLMSLLILPQRLLLSSVDAASIEYSVSAFPTRIQEGLSTNITLTLSGASANTTFTFKLNVTAPTRASYFANVSVKTGANGAGSNMTEFLRDFVNATTNYVGNYRIAVNETLAEVNFTVGLTDKIKYIGFETVIIRGSGYAPNESVTVDVKFSNTSVLGFPRQRDASAEGVLTDSWTIPAGASLGVYNLTLSNATTTVKSVPDIQTFSVEGIFEVQTRNLAGEPLADVTVVVYNRTSGALLLSQDTNETGWTDFVLETSDYTFKAFWKNVEVGAVNKSVTKSVETLRFEVRLSSLKLKVTDERGDPMALIDLNLSYNYTTRFNRTLSGTHSFTTSTNGTVQLQNTFTNISYLITTQRYGLLFNTTLIKNLPALPWNNITIIAPTYTMLVQVLDSKDDPASDLIVEAYEWSSGIGEPLQLNQTDPNGNTTLSVTVGRYRLRLYSDTTFLNEVTVDLTQNKSFVLHSNVYNVTLSVHVVDYFGQPIPGFLVEFQRNVNSSYQTIKAQRSGADGIARFNGVIGGDSRVYVSAAGRPGEIQYLYLVGPATEVMFKMDGYVAVDGYVLETSQFVTIILLLFFIVALIIASSYKRLPRLFKSQKK